MSTVIAIWYGKTNDSLSEQRIISMMGVYSENALIFTDR